MDDEFKKYTRRIWIVLSLLLLLALFAIAAQFLKKTPPATIQNYVGQNGKDGQSLTGPQGIPGYTPIKGVDYFDGTKGDTGSTGAVGSQGIQGIQGVSGIKGDKGDTGEQGPEGKPGRAVFTRYNPETGVPECRYAGDDTWQPESECI